MALRVLLADESSTIKKVMQLALQDFDVEVKAVPVGLDVLDVAKSFQPEIVFADVLLSKRNGYEVCAQLKTDMTLHKVPVVLMWSGFMEIDEKKASIAKPDRRLEKPFDAETLRSLVRDLVPRLQTNVISQFLSFPNLPEIEEDQRAKQYAERQAQKQTPKVPPPPLSPPIKAKVEIPEQIYDPDTLSKFVEQEEAEEFQSVPLPKVAEKAPEFKPAQSQGKNPEPESKEDWARQDLSQFKISIDDDALTREYELAADSLSKSSIAIGTGADSDSMGLEEISLDDMDLGTPGKMSPKKSPALGESGLPSMTQLSHERAEQLIREQAREVLEAVAWKILPDMTERIVREEIQKLLKDAERI